MRQDSWSDVQLLVAINVCLVVLGGWLKGAFIDPLDPGSKANSLWTNTYDVRALPAPWPDRHPHPCCEVNSL